MMEADGRPDGEQIDPIWTTSRTSRQIYALGEVEKDIGRLLALAATSISLLTLPQTDPPGSTLPQGEERSEQFVLDVSEYFERLDQIHINIRSTLAHIRQSRIVPSAIDAPPNNFVPQPSGVGTPSLDTDTQKRGDGLSISPDAGRNQGAATATTDGSTSAEPKRGLQEERINRDAWRGILDALRRLKEARDLGRASQMETDTMKTAHVPSG